MEFLYLLSIILGYAVAHFKSKSSVSRLEERNRNQSDQLNDAEETKKESQRRAQAAENKLAELNADYRNLKERLSEQKGEMQDLQKRFKDEFENLANKILEEKSKKFTEQNKQKLDQLLKPLGEKMVEFRKRVEEKHKEDIKGRSALEQNLKHLHELNQQMSEEAQNLTKALKGESKTQGNWGEVILQRILERSGLTKGNEYVIQEHHNTGDGRRLQPDVVVKLPDKKRLIIDSKVSLTAYERYTTEEQGSKKQLALKQHINSFRNHVKILSSKNYQQLYAGNSPDFVLMFIPIEPAFGIALQHDNELFYEAFDKNIVLVSPSTLLATLATIHSVWKQEYQNKNAIEIAERGGRLYDKFVLFAESMQDIGHRIRQTQESYDEAVSRLSTGHGNVVRQVDMLRKLGANTTKKLPGEFKNAPELAPDDAEE